MKKLGAQVPEKQQLSTGPRSIPASLFNIFNRLLGSEVAYSPLTPQPRVRIFSEEKLSMLLRLTDDAGDRKVDSGLKNVD